MMDMKKTLLSVCAATLLVVPAISILALAQSQPAPLRLFLRSGPKTHGPADNGQHDGPSFLREWAPLLTSRGAKVDGSLKFPTAEQLENTDVLVMFAANAGTILGEDRA